VTGRPEGLHYNEMNNGLKKQFDAEFDGRELRSMPLVSAAILLAPVVRTG
jgi:hypothetical protein